ncbi:MAG: hypothetical protein ACM359_00205 [Bacillota bacterium]
MRCLQAFLLAIFLIVGPHAAHADSAPSTQSLAADCDALLQTVVRRPYGWAWPAPAPADIKLPRGAVLVSFDPQASSTAGLLLYFAGQRLDKGSYLQAACQIARGIAAAQQSNGRIPNSAIFGTSAVPRIPGGPISDRSATCAALGLLLTLADDPTIQDKQIRRTATRAATWLMQQQAPAGGWLAAGGSTEVVGVPPRDPQRRPVGNQRSICLDSLDYRNCTFALVYAYEVLQDASYRRSAEKAIDRLLALRVDKPSKARGLWRSAYDLHDLQPNQTTNDPAHHPLDLLATRYALQTLIGYYLTLGGESTSSAIQSSAQTLESLELLRQKPDTRYRYYSVDNDELTPVMGTAIPAFGPTPPQADVAEVLRTTAELKRSGRVTYRDLLSASCNLRQRLALAICGLSDDPPTLFLPMDRLQASELILKSSELSDAPQSPSSDDLSERVRRIWIQLLRINAD